MARSQHYTARAADTGPIDPRCTYPIAAFHKTTGISKTKLREANLLGLPLPRFTVGKRVFVRGADAIEWLEALSKRLAEKEAEKAGQR